MESILATLPSTELLHRLNTLVGRERTAEAELLIHLGEVDARRLYLEEACSSMFHYCVRVLRFAEGVAYKRIQVARAARRHPELLEAVRRGDLHLTAASLLVPQITRENVAELIESATHRTTEQVRALLADRRPRPDVPAVVTKVSGSASARSAQPSARSTASDHDVQPPAPAPSPTPKEPAPAAPRPEPLGEERYCVRFTADRETWKQLEELRALMRHQIPDGDLAKILGRAIAVLLAQVRKQKLAECERPRPAKPSPSAAPSRAIPAAIRREVSRRDGARCTFVSPNGRRCGSRDFLEFHHTTPWAKHRSHSAEGITLRCRAHNVHEAERDFGRRHMNRFRRTSPDHPRELDLDQVGEASPADP